MLLLLHRQKFWQQITVELLGKTVFFFFFLRESFNLFVELVGNFFFFLESFNLWRPLLMIDFYHQTKTPISFWCRRGLNPRSLIQLSETLPVELTGTHCRKIFIWPTTLLYSLLITCYLNNHRICYNFRFIVKFYTRKKQNQSLIVYIYIFFFCWHIDLK